MCEYSVLTGVSQHLECLVERHKKRNGRDIRIRTEGIEIHLKDRGVRVRPLDVRFPDQERKSPNADEHNEGLQKRRGTSRHRWRFYVCHGFRLDRNYRLSILIYRFVRGLVASQSVSGG